MDEKFFAKHPDPNKQGVNINKAKYDSISGTILVALANGKELTLKDLFAAVRKTMKGKFDGSISWYTTVVKLDLEARKLIARVPNSKPHRVRLK